MTTHNNLLSTIGSTPVIHLHQFDTGPCELYIKLENQNPTGSIKDRIALYMIEQAEQKGLLQPGSTLIEGTAGNTGLGLALVAQQKGYQCIIVMPDKMSKEKIVHLEALGATVVTTRSDVVKGHPDYYLDIAERLAHETPNAFYVNQFNNPDNVAAHYNLTGPEIWQDMEGQLDAFVAGMGTSGTLTGAGRYLKEQNPNLELVLADPVGSILADYVNHGHMGQAGGWLVEGIGEDYIPSISGVDEISCAYTIDDKTAFNTSRALLKQAGIIAGSSTGTLLAAAIRYCQQQTEAKRVLTFACDTGNKYLSKVYNTAWLATHGFHEFTRFNDCRDILNFNPSAKVHIQASLPLVAAHKKMLDNQLFALPVLEGERCVGLLDSPLLCQLFQTKPSCLDASIGSIMRRDVACMPMKTPLNEINPIISQHMTVILEDEQRFVGQINLKAYSHYLNWKLQHDNN